MFQSEVDKENMPNMHEVFISLDNIIDQSVCHCIFNALKSDIYVQALILSSSDFKSVEESKLWMEKALGRLRRITLQAVGVSSHITEYVVFCIYYVSDDMIFLV